VSRLPQNFLVSVKMKGEFFAPSRNNNCGSEMSLSTFLVLPVKSPHSRSAPLNPLEFSTGFFR
jgi:hypothetical protein